MTLLLDLGNTRLKAAWLRDGEPRDVARFTLDDDDLAPAFAAWLRESQATPATTAGLRDLPAPSPSTVWLRDSQATPESAAGLRDAREAAGGDAALARDAQATAARGDASPARDTRATPARGSATRSPRAWLAAVAPDSVLARVTGLLAAQGIPTERVMTQSNALGVRIAYADPSRLGVDRWLNLVAARRRIDGPVLVASVGTALTIDALLADGTHLGGLIAASPEAARAALVAKAPRLDVPRGRVSRFAASTEDALESGATLAATALIERSLHELERQAGSPALLLLTGGGAPALRPWLSAHHHVEDLVLHGLAAWALAAGG